MESERGELLRGFINRRDAKGSESYPLSGSSD